MPLGFSRLIPSARKRGSPAGGGEASAIGVDNEVCGGVSDGGGGDVVTDGDVERVPGRPLHAATIMLIPR